MNWRPEPTQSTNNGQLDSQQIPTATEVNPSLYDELKLGHKGAGFKRLVS